MLSSCRLPLLRRAALLLARGCLCGARCRASIALLDIGSNLGAISRAALLAADHVVVPVAVDPVFRPIASDPRYKDILRRLALSEAQTR